MKILRMNQFVVSQVFCLCFISGFFAALQSATDNLIVKQVIVFPADPFTAVLVYLVLGSWIGVVTQFFTSNFFGSRISPDFAGIKSFKFGELRFAFVSGLLSAVATMFFIWGSQLVDPTVVVVLTNAYILYLLFYDTAMGNVKMSSLCWPSLFIIIGSVLASLKDLTGFETTLLGLAIFLLGQNGANAVSKILDQRGARKAIDPVNYAFWRFIGLATSATCLAIGLSVIRGRTTDFWDTFASFLLPAFPYIIVLMIFVTFANAYEIAARKVGQTSIVSMLVTIKVAVILPITLAGDAIIPNLFGELPSSTLVWMLRIVGAGFVIWGIIKLYANHLRAETTLKPAIPVMDE